MSLDNKELTIEETQILDGEVLETIAGGYRPLITPYAFKKQYIGPASKPWSRKRATDQKKSFENAVDKIVRDARRADRRP